MSDYLVTAFLIWLAAQVPLAILVGSAIRASYRDPWGADYAADAALRETAGPPQPAEA
jgi:hypothetical protein